MRNRLGKFEEVPSSVLIAEDYSSFPYDALPSMGCAWADYGNDGFQDLYVAVNSGFKSRLYQNGTNQYRWLSVTLKGKSSNANGIGAMVKIKVNGRWQYRWVQSGSGFAAQNSFPLAFGLGTSTQVDSLVIRWPSGIVQELKNVASNQMLRVTETSIVTGVSNVQEANTKLYPNPARVSVVVELKTNQLLTKKIATVFDARGSVKQFGVKQIGINRYSIDINELPNGIYWLELKAINGLIREKFVVMH